MDATDRAEGELATLTGLLDREGFEVAEVAADRAGKVRRLTVVPTGVVGLCPHCQRPTDERHACHDREVVDLPPGGWKTERVVRGRPFRCGGRGRFSTPRHPALAEGAHATERFLGRLAELATGGDVAAAARFFGVAEKTAERWHYDHLERPRTRPPPNSPWRNSRGRGSTELAEVCLRPRAGTFVVATPRSRPDAAAHRLAGVPPRAAKDLRPVASLGIDELSTKKGAAGSAAC